MPGGQEAQSRESLEPTPLERRFPQLSIVEPSLEEPRKQPVGRGPLIVEQAEDGTFDLAEAEDDDEPPPLDGEAGGEAGGGGSGAEETPTEEPSLMDEMMQAAEAARKEKKDKAKAEQKRVKKEFGSGLKKGFFSSSGGGTGKKKKKPTGQQSKSKTPASTHQPSSGGGSSAKVEAIPTLKAAKDTKKNDLVLDEVQDAMKSAGGGMGQMLQDGAWMTEDLMTKFAKNPLLAKGLSDPRYTAAIQELQKNPKQAMEKFQHDPELSAFLNEFCQTMGEHFTKLGDQQQPPVDPATAAVHGPLAEDAVRRASERAKQSPSPPPQPSKEEDAQVQRIMQDTELRELLMDSGLQRVMMECQQPGKLQMYMRDKTWGPKLRKLADAGLV
eukprot:CAMPEP_0118974134 /NCGR_PEP_ID=MMETSP1173-20130426/11090_1 /TAXON_ID=1034831 /ORGANISM="Rhizochromulina marina cf, Strain CCMP1243" /LENGTH=383 /DNA_ID=CAMNT_0006923843 /DNA_START=15 /DNA_END=1163 /DNA_ORIENTATION=-